MQKKPTRKQPTCKQAHLLDPMLKAVAPQAKEPVSYPPKNQLILKRAKRNENKRNKK
ncbi:MAG: hypothetical protein ACPGLV_15585 [Bacteroidia bacterium]